MQQFDPMGEFSDSLYPQISIGIVVLVIIGAILYAIEADP